jgi:hypothetical protein
MMTTTTTKATTTTDRVATVTQALRDVAGLDGKVTTVRSSGTRLRRSSCPKPPRGA